jgi:hypothetical protein
LLNSSNATRTRSGKAEPMSINCRRTGRKAASEKKGGRKKAHVTQPGLKQALEEIVADHTAGSPIHEDIRWTNQSPREMSEQLKPQGFFVGPDTVRNLLREELGLSVRQASKQEAAREFPFRNEQFEHIAELRDWYLQKQWPVLSIDTKKKELLGNFFSRRQGVQRWAPEGSRSRLCLVRRGADGAVRHLRCRSQ